MKHRHRSLRTKLTLTSAVLGLGPLVLMGAVILWVITITHRQDVATMETQLLNQKIEEIDKFVEGTFGLFEIQVGYEQLLEPLPDQQKFLLQNLLLSNKNIIEASLVYAIEAQREVGVDPLSDCRGNKLDQDSAFGQEICRMSQFEEEESIEFTNLSKLDKFKIAAAGKKYFGPVYYTLNGPVMTFASPVLNRNNQIIMVLTGEVSLASLQDIISSARLGKNGYVYMLDQDGTILASADKDFIYKSVADSVWIKELLAGTRHTGLDEDDSRLGLLGIEVLSAGIPISKFSWAIVSEWPRQDAFSVVATIRRQAFLFSLFVLLVVAMLGWLVGRKILHPLAVLREGAQRIGSGKFDYKIAITTRDEIEELGEVFNRMGDDLKRLEELKAAEIRATALAESLRKERELSKIKDEFMANTSHQLRTPLSIMNWGFELLDDTKINKEQETIITDVKSGLEQINAIVSDLILASEFGPGFRNTVHEPVNLQEILTKVVESRKALLGKKQLVWREEISKELPVISGNPRAIEIVLNNLIDNAITYSREKGEVKAKIQVQDNNLHLSLADLGIGIPEKDKGSIFLQFFRAENAIAGKNVGTGLGLYISKNIIEGHGGKIWFESEEGKGSTFHIALPLRP